MDVRMHVYMHYIYVCMHTFQNTQTQQAYIHVYMYICTYRYTYACIYVLHIRMYVHIASFIFLIRKKSKKNVVK